MLTNIRGERLNYEADVQYANKEGVLATAHWVAHQEYVDALKDCTF